MLSPTDIKLFEILDEFIDKTLSFWCLIKINWYWDEIFFYINKEKWIINYIDNEWNYLDNTIEDIYIIWHRPTLSTFTRFLYLKKPNLTTIINKWCVLTIIDNYVIKNLDFSEELQHRTEEKKQGLLLFLQSI
jgi:hypothetical protein